jgi:hypothetical protein
MIDTKFWDDPFTAELTPPEKLLFLYYLTNPQVKISGIYEIRIKQVSFDTGINEKQILEINQKFEKNNKIYFVDNWVIINNFIKYQTINPSVLQGIQRELDNLPPQAVDRLHTVCTQAVGYLTKLNLTKLNLTIPKLDIINNNNNNTNNNISSTNNVSDNTNNSSKKNFNIITPPFPPPKGEVLMDGGTIVKEVMDFWEATLDTKIPLSKGLGYFPLQELINHYGKEKVCGAILAIAENINNKYFPAINNPKDLQDKWLQVMKVTSSNQTLKAF